MSDLRSNLRGDFHDRDFRTVYADESLNTYIATQIKVLREQQELTQKELALLAGMAQPRIAVLEDVNYSSWSISTLRRLARAFDLRLSVRFETFSSLLPELETFGRSALERAKFSDDEFFHETSHGAPLHGIGAYAHTTSVNGNVVDGNLFMEHMRRVSQQQKGQGQEVPTSLRRTGGENAAFSSATG